MELKYLHLNFLSHKKQVLENLIFCQHLDQDEKVLEYKILEYHKLL